MRRGFVALGIALGMVLRPSPAPANDHLTGIVLMAPAGGEVVVHHHPFGGMPAMTMTFRVDGSPSLKPGDQISADVDRSSDPWSLEHVAVVAARNAVSSAPPLPMLRTGDAVPDIAFLDQRGRELRLPALRGGPFALSFIYTRCTDGKMCPLVSAKFHTLLQQLGSGAALVEVSLDPAYDRPPVLARYASAYAVDPARWHLLTGDPRTVLDFAARFGILEEAAGPVKIVHSERLAVIGADGRIRRLFDDAAWSPNEVLHALREAAAPPAR